LTCTTGAYTEAVTSSLNNVFSPDGGGSAVGYAKAMALYSKAFVLGARIKVTGNGTQTAGTYVVGVTITTNNTSLATIPAAIANGMCQYTSVLANPDHFVLNEAVDVARFLNKPRILDDSQLFCTSGAGPTQLIVAHVWSSSLFVATTYTLSYVAEYEFDVVFTDPIPFT
jgi:hypothetical protein